MVDTSATNAVQQVGHLTFGLWRIRPALYSEPLSHFGHLMTTFAESGVDSFTEVSSVSDESSSVFDHLHVQHPLALPGETVGINATRWRY